MSLNLIPMIKRITKELIASRKITSLMIKTDLQIQITGYNQSVTGCGSQRRHVVITQRKLM